MKCIVFQAQQQMAALNLSAQQQYTQPQMGAAMGMANWGGMQQQTGNTMSTNLWQ